MTVHVCVCRLHDCRLHDCACVSGGYKTIHVCGCYMTVHVWRLHDCTYMSGGYMTVHVSVNRSVEVELS